MFRGEQSVTGRCYKPATVVSAELCKKKSFQCAYKQKTPNCLINKHGYVLLRKCNLTVRGLQSRCLADVNLVDAGSAFGFLFRGSVQTPQRRKATLSFTGGTRQGLSASPDATISSRCHLPNKHKLLVNLQKKAVFVCL